MRFTPLAFAAAVIVAAPSAHADVLLTNLGEPESATTIVTEDLWAAQSFANDGNTWTLTSIRTVVGDAVGAPNVFAELREGSVTGTVLTAFSLPSFAGAHSVRTFTPLTETTLTPGGLYYFILGLTGADSEIGWTYALGNNQSGPGAFQNYEYSEDQGATWTNFGEINPYLIEINVEAVGAGVPEPAAWALMILGFGAAGSVLRSRRRAAAA